MRTGTCQKLFSACVEVRVSYLAEVDLIEDNLVGVCNGVEAGCESEDGDDKKSQLVVPVIGGCLLGLGLQLCKVFAGLIYSTVDLLFGASRSSLLGARRRRHDEKKAFKESREEIRKDPIRSSMDHHPHSTQIDGYVEGWRAFERKNRSQLSQPNSTFTRQLHLEPSLGHQGHVDPYFHPSKSPLYAPQLPRAFLAILPACKYMQGQAIV